MNEEFSGRAWVFGCSLAISAGFLLNVAAMAIGLRINITAVSIVLGTLPGICLAIGSRHTKGRDFSAGMLVGGIVIGLLGGACGWIATATQVKT